MIKSPEGGIELYANEIELNLDDIIPTKNYEYKYYWHTSSKPPTLPADTRIVAISVVSTEDVDREFGPGCAVRLVNYDIGLTTDAEHQWKWRCLFVPNGSAAPSNFWQFSFDDSEWVSDSIAVRHFYDLSLETEVPGM